MTLMDSVSDLNSNGYSHSYKRMRVPETVQQANLTLPASAYDSMQTPTVPYKTSTMQDFFCTNTTAPSPQGAVSPKDLWSIQIQSIYFKDSENLKRGMINPNAVIDNIKFFNRRSNSSMSGHPHSIGTKPVKWKAVLKNLKQNPKEMMALIPSPRDRSSSRRATSRRPTSIFN